MHKLLISDPHLLALITVLSRGQQPLTAPAEIEVDDDVFAKIKEKRDHIVSAQTRQHVTDEEALKELIRESTAGLG